MATYLVVENNKYTKSYKLKTTFGSNPYIKVSNSYLDLQEYQITDTAGIKARVNVKDYVPKEASETITTTASRKSTYTVSYVSGRSSSTSGYEGYSSVVDMWKGYSTGTIISGVSSKQSGYYTSSVDKTTLSNITTLTKQSNYSFTDVTSAGMSSTEALTRASNYTMTAVNSAGMSSVTTLYSNVLTAYDGESSSIGDEAVAWKAKHSYNVATKWKAKHEYQVATAWSAKFTYLGNVTAWSGVTEDVSYRWAARSSHTEDRWAGYKPGSEGVVQQWDGYLIENTYTRYSVNSITAKETKSLTTLASWSGPATYNGKSYSSLGEKVYKFYEHAGSTNNTYGLQNGSSIFHFDKVASRTYLASYNTQKQNHITIYYDDPHISTTISPVTSEAGVSYMRNTTVNSTNIWKYTFYIPDVYVSRLWSYNNKTATASNKNASYTHSEVKTSDSASRRTYSYSSFSWEGKTVGTNVASNTNWLASTLMTDTVATKLSTGLTNSQGYQTTRSYNDYIWSVYISSTNNSYMMKTTNHWLTTLVETVNNITRMNSDDGYYSYTQTARVGQLRTIDRTINSVGLSSTGAIDWETKTGDKENLYNSDSPNYYDYVATGFSMATETVENLNNNANTNYYAYTATAWRQEVETVYNLYNSTNPNYYAYTATASKTIIYTKYNQANSAGLSNTTGKYSQQATGYSGYSSRTSTSGYKGYSSRESISGYSGYATRASQYYTSSAAVGNMSSTTKKTTTNYQSVVESPSAAGLVETSIAHTSKWYRTSNVYNNGLSSTSYLTNTYYTTSYTTNGGISSTTEKTYESTRSSTYETTQYK